MAGAKEIRSKIASIKSTQKITSAMEKVAVSKMRKAQMRMAASRPYAERIRQVIGHLANANPEYRHPFMIDREVKRVGYVVVSSDRGLCGGLNTNLFKALVKDMAVNRETASRSICVLLVARVRLSSATSAVTSLQLSATWVKSRRSMI